MNYPATKLHCDLAGISCFKRELRTGFETEAPGTLSTGVDAEQPFGPHLHQLLILIDLSLVIADTLNFALPDNRVGVEVSIARTATRLADAPRLSW
jgi:hypothetical protein